MTTLSVVELETELTNFHCKLALEAKCRQPGSEIRMHRTLPRLQEPKSDQLGWLCRSETASVPAPLAFQVSRLRESKTGREREL